MRKRVFDIIEVAQKGDTLSNVYDMVMMVVIIASIVPLAFKAQPEIFRSSTGLQSVFLSSIICCVS